LLIYCNHTSCYDGFLVHRIAKLLRPDCFFVLPMVEREYVRRRYFSLLGAIPLSKSASSIRYFVRALENIRTAQKERLVLAYFPQGRITPSTCRDLKFERGLEFLVPRLSPIQCVPAAIQFEMLQGTRPQIFFTLGVPIQNPIQTVEFEQRVQLLLTETRAEIEELGEDFGAHHRPDWEQISW